MPFSYKDYFELKAMRLNRCRNSSLPSHRLSAQKQGPGFLVRAPPSPTPDREEHLTSQELDSQP